MNSTPGDLQSIDEIITLAELEPDLRNVFVEGRDDAALFSWYLSQKGIDVVVIAISDRVYVPREEVLGDGRDYGEREKLVSLARRVDESLASNDGRITVIIDSDWAAAVGPAPLPQECLFLTDLPSVEFYFYTKLPFEKFLMLGAGAVHHTFASVSEALEEALVQVAGVRLVLAKADIKCLDSFAELCEFTALSSSVDTRELLRRSLSGVSKTAWPASLDEMTIWASGFADLLRDAGHPGRGHDIAPLLIKHLKLGNKLRDPELVERLMRSTTEAEHLDDFPLFVELSSRW